MTLFDMVERERRGVARHLTTAGMGLVGSVVFAVLLLAVLALGDARWLSLPRVLPFLLWALALGAALIGGRYLRARLTRATSVSAIARAVEEERTLRSGSLRGALEVA